MSVTDTSQTTLRTELRIARSALKGLRDDLITDAFAFRPLPPRPTDGTVVSRLPERLRDSARWLPHAFLTAFACFLMLVGFEFESERGGAALAAALLTGIPLFTVLFRPVGGWWLSFGAAFLSGAAAGQMAIGDRAGGTADRDLEGRRASVALLRGGQSVRIEAGAGWAHVGGLSSAGAWTGRGRRTTRRRSCSSSRRATAFATPRFASPS